MASHRVQAATLHPPPPDFAAPNSACLPNKTASRLPTGETRPCLQSHKTRGQSSAFMNSSFVLGVLNKNPETRWDTTQGTSSGVSQMAPRQDGCPGPSLAWKCGVKGRWQEGRPHLRGLVRDPPGPAFRGAAGQKLPPTTVIRVPRNSGKRAAPGQDRKAPPPPPPRHTHTRQLRVLTASAPAGAFHSERHRETGLRKNVPGP